MQVSLALFHQRQGAHPYKISRDFRHRGVCPVSARQVAQIQLRRMEPRGRLVEGEVGEHLVRDKTRWINHRSCQRLIQVGHGCQQTSRIGKLPAPSCMFREDERKVTCYLLSTPFWPE